VRAPVLLAVALLALVELAEGRPRAFVDHALAVEHEDVLALHAQAHHHVQAGDGRGAGALTHQLDLADGLPTSSSPLSSAPRC
jgi:hypothetical protein